MAPLIDHSDSRSERKKTIKVALVFKDALELWLASRGGIHSLFRN
jgi:hypothetical protein